MALEFGQVTVSDTATEIVPSNGTEHRHVLLHDPSGGASVFIGDSTVTTTTGFELEAQETESFRLEPGESLWGIVSTGTQTVSYFAS